MQKNMSSHGDHFQNLVSIQQKYTHMDGNQYIGRYPQLLEFEPCGNCDINMLVKANAREDENSNVQRVMHGMTQDIAIVGASEGMI